MLPRSPPLPFTQRTSVGSAGERIGLDDFGAGVAAAEIGDAQVGAEEVGAVTEKLGLVEAGGELFVPQIVEEAQRGRESS